MFEWLFKFNRISFAEGEIGFQAGGAFYAFAVLMVLLLVGLGVVYYWTNRFPEKRVRAISLGLRVAALALLCLPLFEPVLIMPDVVPDENFVAVLVDGSESMNVPDGQFGPTRRDDAQHLLFGEADNEDDGIVPALAAHFKLRYYTFSEQANRVDSLYATRPDGRKTNLTAALDRVISDFKGVPLSGIVLLTDGGDNSAEIPLNKAEELRALDIPLHIVGVGRPAFTNEREILDVTVSKSVEENTGAEIDVKVRSWGQEDAPVTFNIFQGEDRVFSEARTLKGEGKIDQLTFFYEPQQTGAREYTLQIEEARGERNQENNTTNLLIDTRKDTLRVLYFEGSLRRDFKFIKRALEDDQVIEFASVSRTGTGKFYRQGIRSADEMSGGFPNSQGALNRFKAIIFGDVEASFFTIDQLGMIEQFVRNRGGGYLMLGGRNSFAEGDYWNTPIADLLPVELDLGRRTVVPPRFFDPNEPVDEQGFRFAPTAVGYESPILKLSPEPSANRTRWSSMPPLTSLNFLGSIKPGASVLAEKREDDFGAPEPLLIVQRYGKGRTAALATASTWRWQMHLDANDTRHERFWRQLARWMAASAPDRVDLNLGQRRFTPGDEMPITLNVYDPLYAPLAGATVSGQITDPRGTVHPITLQPALTEPGTYVTTFVPQEEGVHEVVLVAFDGGTLVGDRSESFLVRPSKREFYDATLKRGFLENLATTNGGVYYSADATDDLPVNLRSRRTSTSIFHAVYLWDMPLLFLLALALLSAEWIYRRRKGLP